ncbi:MAG: sigma-E processing peptidase SpoIIGA [Oscillospiraceae bacterium]|nr:sigma-E processing peptidase SpoIIGA [Oscillospiraceae bacterium]
MRIIYADILLVINLAVDYLLLFATARIAGLRFERIKGLLGAIIGAVYSLMILFDFSGIVFAATKFIVSAVMLLVTFGKRKAADFFRLILIFYICGFIFSGFMMLINSFAKTDSFFVKGGVVYFEFSAMEIVVSGTAAFIVTEILRRLFRHGEPEGICMVKISYRGKNIVLKGFTDTGNSLSEPFSGSPVAVASADSLEKLLPKDMFSEMKKDMVSTDARIKSVFCSTVSGTVLINAFRPEKVVIENENGSFIAEDILVAISENVPDKTIILGKNIILSEEGKVFSEV